MTPTTYSFYGPTGCLQLQGITAYTGPPKGFPDMTNRRKLADGYWEWTQRSPSDSTPVITEVTGIDNKSHRVELLSISWSNTNPLIGVYLPAIGIGATPRYHISGFHCETSEEEHDHHDLMSRHPNLSGKHPWSQKPLSDRSLATKKEIVMTLIDIAEMYMGSLPRSSLTGFEGRKGIKRVTETARKDFGLDPKRTEGEDTQSKGDDEDSGDGDFVVL